MLGIVSVIVEHSQKDREWLSLVSEYCSSPADSGNLT